MNLTVPPTPPPPPLPSKRIRRGFLDKDKVKAASFVTITLCLIISVVACILAIWDFTKKDTLFRTVATCAVIAGGMMAFGVINELYGPKE